MDAQELIQRYNGGERDFSVTQLFGATLRGAELSGADLSGANLKGANLAGAIMPNGTVHERVYP